MTFKCVYPDLYSKNEFYAIIYVTCTNTDTINVKKPCAGIFVYVYKLSQSKEFHRRILIFLRAILSRLILLQLLP